MPILLLLQLPVTKGQTVLQQSFPQASGTFKQVLDLKNQAPGVYLLQLIAGEEVIVKKVVVE